MIRGSKLTVPVVFPSKISPLFDHLRIMPSCCRLRSGDSVTSTTLNHDHFRAKRMPVNPALKVSHCFHGETLDESRPRSIVYAHLTRGEISVTTFFSSSSLRRQLATQSRLNEDFSLMGSKYDGIHTEAPRAEKGRYLISFYGASCVSRSEASMLCACCILTEPGRRIRQNHLSLKTKF